LNTYFERIVENLRCWIVDPLKIRHDLNHINSSIAKFQGDLHHHTRRLEELIKAFTNMDEKLENQMFLEQVNRALHYSVPDMFWVKDLEGRYIKANDAIRKNLLFCEDPIGRDDRSIAQDIVDRIGKENHTFGAICGNSDLEVIRQETSMKFNEDGIVNGEYMMFQVHKNVVRDAKGNVIAVVGVGRDITYEVELLNKGLALTKCEESRSIFKEIIEHYKFSDRS
jgi:PAS domain-containing protein